MKRPPPTLTPTILAELAQRYYDRHESSHYGHNSRLASEALQYASKAARRELGGAHPGYHGVEGSVEPDLLYLNAGDTYTETVIATGNNWGRYVFSAGCWGDSEAAYSESLTEVCALITDLHCP